MYNLNEIHGVDISKDFFDVVNTSGEHSQFTNNLIGFKKFSKTLSRNSLVVMEATGYYHYCLAQYLYSKNYLVSVVNPLSVKRFIQMKLSKIKTDKSDAKAICEYAIINKVPLYTAKNKNQAECLQIMRLLDIYLKQSTALKNKIHGEKVLGNPSKAVYHSLNRSLKFIKNEIKFLENKLFDLINEHYSNQLELLKTIPGLGIKTALMLIVTTNGFSNFENANQLCCYTGITPTIRHSGSSVRGKSRISKIGNKKLRNLLFLCSFSAVKYNKTCKALYNRIVEKGKSKKLALIAICNKLLKQAFAIVKSGLPYNEDYISKLI
ncbi:IS110 family transposase [Lutibacter sp. TH_r2]|uniref:IS110 family transposase n=1 Tax=Lutibacter sp. TH_r2 TaxID=3082083 RepID=UPI00295488C1|nr:IS110 family transposase [Lutibacter sp. TH_r2]MDV7187983.1 IS110 family transposase [Lutibacter sp. TH_r2]